MHLLPVPRQYLVDRWTSSHSPAGQAVPLALSGHSSSADATSQVVEAPAVGQEVLDAWVQTSMQAYETALKPPPAHPRPRDGHRRFPTLSRADS